MISDSNPLVSVLMTCYNREKYIAQAIESVLTSGYANFELIIVDDASNDNSVKIAKKYEKLSPKVKVFVNEKNLGDYPNRNVAASYAVGKYLKYVDADDLIYPWGLKLMVKLMEKFPEAGWGLCNPQDDKKPFPFCLNPEEIYTYNYKISNIFHRSPLSAIIKREVFEAVKGFANIRMAGDFEMWNRLGQKFPLVLLPQGTAWYRKHEEQEMSSFRKYIKTYESIKVKYLKDPKCPLEKNSVNAIMSSQKKKLRSDIVRSFLTLNVRGVNDIYQKLCCWR